VIDELLSRFTYSFPYFDQVMLVDPQGGIVASSYLPSVGESLFTHFDQTRDEFDRALKSPPGSVFVTDLSDVSDPLRHARGRRPAEQQDFSISRCSRLCRMALGAA